ncbi:hypothetical protein ABG768_028209 [Culter alburnus]|uniref:Chemokine interleukin-8-like domain-containing protein n=1 Tax=Culter alburnus TaxID=194366 RepID=A0AAW1YTQ5_CULAL
MMKSLAAIAVIMSVMIMETNGEEKSFECCTRVSTKKIMVPITGFKIQKENRPCVTAVIFNTTEGPMCSHGGLKWVREKVKELMKLQRHRR